MKYYLIIALIGYLFGCSNLAFFLSKARGFDIRERGSNNAGASNATVTMGLMVGFLVGLHDVAKAFIAALFATYLFPEVPEAAVVAGAAAVIGHIFPFYLKFQGGKGLASLVGLILAWDWKFGLLLMLAILLITLISDYIVLGTLTAVVVFPIYLTISHAPPLAIGVICCTSVIMFLKHRINIKRLFSGEEIGLRRALSKQDKVSKS